MFAFAVGHIGYAEDAPQFSGIHFHRSGLRRRAGRGLRKRGGHRGVEIQVPLGLFHYLVDVPVEHGHRTETFQEREGARAIFRAPTPLRVNFPERDVREDNDGRAVGNSFQIVGDPRELVLAEHAEPALANVEDVIEADEMRPLVIEAKPAIAFCSLAEPFEILFAVVVQDIVLARDVKDAAALTIFQNLLERVEFLRLREVGEIAGVENEIRRRRQRVDLGHRFLQGAEHILVCFLVEPNVAVADLHEGEISADLRRLGAAWPQNSRDDEAAARGPEHARSGPGHAFQKAAPVDAVMVVIVYQVVVVHK